jgi:3-demethoxyubiquinol 3-hydroxylase
MALHACSKRANILAANLPVYDFLAPSLFQASRASHQLQPSITGKRFSSVAVSNDVHSASPSKLLRTPKSGENASSNPAPLNKVLTQAQRDFLTSAVCLTQPPNSFQWQ